MDSSVLHVAVITVEALEVLRLASKDDSNVSEEVMSTRIAKGSVDPMSEQIQCF